MRSKADRELIEKAKKLTERQRLMEEVLAKRRPVNGFDLDALQSEIQRDFGVPIDRTLIQQATDEIERLQGKEFRAVVDSAEVEGVLPSVGVSSSPEIDWFSRPDEEIRPLFERIKDDLCARVYGQDRACSELVDAYRRPYLDRSVDRVRQTIFLFGPNGSGRHYLLEQSALLMAENKLWQSHSIARLDMRQYPSSSQEAVFLQDLYVCLKSDAPILLIEHFEEANAIYNKMIGQLITEGVVQLSKRYTVKNNALQESTHLHEKNLIGELDGNGKVLVLLSQRKPSILLDLYGKSVYDAIADKIGMEVLDPKALEEIVGLKLDGMKLSVFEKLGVTLEIDASVSHQLVSLFEPDNGVDSITPTIARLYETLVNLVLKRPKFESLALRYESGESVPIDRGDPGEEAALPYERGYRARIGDDDLLLDVEDDSEGEIAAIKKELEEIVGLEEVKRYMLSLEDVVRMQRIRKQTGMRVDEISKHMIFTGNPGTGKTTIARLVSRLMKAIGVLEQGQLVEVTRADLVGRYVGHTAPLTMSVIRSALGGVLFIDEAYSLYRGKDDSFGLEAIDTLVKAMEDHRDDLIVILAGYSKEMAEFLESNSGLRSRFPNRIFFRDYTADELVRIAQSVAKRKEYRIEETALEPLRVYFEKKQEHPAENGNGRLARNVVEAAIIKQSNRLVAAGNEFRRDELDQLIPEDFELDA